jgi:hypothetical protein
MCAVVRQVWTAIVGTAILVGVVAAPARAQGTILPAEFEGVEERDRTDVKSVLEDSFRLLLMQHALRIAAQQKTRDELGGPFFLDYHRSVRMPRQWGDGDRDVTNYLGHPALGAIVGHIWAQNSPREPKGFELSRDYWSSRVKALAWMTGYSLQFEIGPLSEATIGNVGMNPATAGWTDHVVTPAGGFVWMVGEDALDRFVISKLERRVRSPYLRAPIRMLLNPSRAAANVAARRLPWYRDERPVRDERLPPE